MVPYISRVVNFIYTAFWTEAFSQPLHRSCMSMSPETVQSYCHNSRLCSCQYQRILSAWACNTCREIPSTLDWQRNQGRPPETWCQHIVNEIQLSSVKQSHMTKTRPAGQHTLWPLRLHAADAHDDLPYAYQSWMVSQVTTDKIIFSSVHWRQQQGSSYNPLP